LANGVEPLLGNVVKRRHHGETTAISIVDRPGANEQDPSRPVLALNQDFLPEYVFAVCNGAGEWLLVRRIKTSIRVKPDLFRILAKRGDLEHRTPENLVNQRIGKDYPATRYLRDHHPSRHLLHDRLEILVSLWQERGVVVRLEQMVLLFRIAHHRSRACAARSPRQIARSRA